MDQFSHAASPNDVAGQAGRWRLHPPRSAAKAINLYSPGIDLPTGMRLRQSGDQIIFARMNPAQCRMARAALQWSTADLAKAAGVGNSTVNRFETGDAKPIASTLTAMQRALEQAGAVFLSAGEMVDGGPGVRLREAEKA